jgi:hypothetical protein
MRGKKKRMATGHNIPAERAGYAQSLQHDDSRMLSFAETEPGGASPKRAIPD